MNKGDLNLQKVKKKIHNSILDSFKKQGNQFLPQNGIIIIIDTGNLIFYEWSIKSDGVCILLQNINLKKKSNTNVISRAGKKNFSTQGDDWEEIAPGEHNDIGDIYCLVKAVLWFSMDVPLFIIHCHIILLQFRWNNFILLRIWIHAQ